MRGAKAQGPGPKAGPGPGGFDTALARRRTALVRATEAN